MSNILVVGLNPAWQSVLEFAALRTGEVNRAETRLALASGKGINAAKVLRTMGHQVSLLQILGGGNGRKCLEACAALGITSHHAWVETETRQCLSLVDRSSGAATEIIEPFAVNAPDLGKHLLSSLPVEADAFDALVFSGSVPTGGPADFFDRLLERFQPRVVLLDSTRQIGPGSMGKITCVKVNRREYEVMTARPGWGGGAAPVFLVTDGPGEAAVLRAGKTQCRFQIPRLAAVCNPIGAGDTVTAGVAHFLLEGFDAEEAFRRGLAMGSASCLLVEPAAFDTGAYLELLPQVKRLAHA